MRSMVENVQNCPELPVPNRQRYLSYAIKKDPFELLHFLRTGIFVDQGSLTHFALFGNEILHAVR